MATALKWAKMTKSRPPRILLAPLDWGLGHATRCIPIIRYLIEKKYVVTLAAQGATALLLKSNFPDLKILPIAGYHVEYSRSGSMLPFKILMQVPKILAAIKAERLWLEQIQKQYQFDLVISDNRYGLKIEGLPSVILTHQLLIKSGCGSLFDQLLCRIHFRILEKFDSCWVVDRAGADGIGGELSHPKNIPVNARYIGVLSQLEIPEVEPKMLEGNILVLLSGPEPQRGILEQKIVSQIISTPHYSYILVGGKPGSAAPENLPQGTIYYAHRNASELASLITSAKLVVCRSGYSTLMDLLHIGKKALLIPTPGQPEQPYLADYLGKQGLFYYQKQSHLDLKTDIAEALKYPGFTRQSVSLPYQAMNAAVDEMMERIG